MTTQDHSQEIVERVAWKIHLAFWMRQYGEQVGSAQHAAKISWEANKENRCDEARAAIEAMREIRQMHEAIKAALEEGNG